MEEEEKGLNATTDSSPSALLDALPEMGLSGPVD